MVRADDLRAMRNRWQAVGASNLGLLTSGLMTGRTDESPFGYVEGRLDLRGLPLSFPLTRETMAARGSRLTVGESKRTSRRSSPATRLRRRLHRRGGGPSWTDLDLSGANLAEMNWFDLVVRNCVLDDADLSHLRCWGVRVLNTSMRRTSLYQAQIGAGQEWWPRRSLWQGVDLRQSDMRGAHGDVRFEQVDFRNAKFTGTALGWSDLVNCQFAGVMRGVTIGRKPIAEQPKNWTLQGIDLTSARPRNLGLVGVDLGTPRVDIRFPSDSEHWVVPDWNAFLLRLSQLISTMATGRERSSAEIWVEHAQSNVGTDQREGFIAAWDLEDFGGKAFRDLVARAL